MINHIPEKDIKAVVQIHLAAFQSFFLSQMGESFLFLYYNAVRKMQGGILLGYYEDGVLKGFSAATTLSEGFHKKLLLHNFISFGLVALKLVFKRPSALIHLAANMTKKPEGVIKDSFQYGELFSIAVMPDNQGKGIGKKLICATEQEMMKQEQTELSLTTDAVNNESAISFYRANGFQTKYEFVAYPSRKMFRMNKRIS